MKDNPIVIVNGPGGCPFVTDPLNPHLGGNFDGGDEGTRYPKDLWPWFLAKYNPSVVLDVGCGTGEAAGWFRRYADLHAIGLDGLPYNAVETSKRHGVPCLVWDFRNGPLRIEGVDLTWCSDIAEHIDEEYLPNFFETLRHTKTLAMCQGLETSGPCGWHHVTNKPQEWWVEKLAGYGLIEDVEATKKSREIAPHGWWLATGRIYRRVD